MEAWRLKIESWRVRRQVFTLVRTSFRIRIRIKVKSWITIHIVVKSWVRISEKLDQGPYYSDMQIRNNAYNRCSVLV